MQTLSQALRQLPIPGMTEPIAVEISRLWKTPISLFTNREGVLTKLAWGEDPASPTLAPLAIRHLNQPIAKTLMAFLESDAGQKTIAIMQRNGIVSDNHNPLPGISGPILTSEPIAGKHGKEFPSKKEKIHRNRW